MVELKLLGVVMGSALVLCEGKLRGGKKANVARVEKDDGNRKLSRFWIPSDAAQNGPYWNGESTMRMGCTLINDGRCDTSDGQIRAE